MFQEYKAGQQYGNGNGNGQLGIGFDNLVQPHMSQNSFKEFIEAGKNILDLLMRTNLLDENEATNLALAISYCEEFHLESDLRSLFYLLAARPSIKGGARRQLLQAVTGILSPQMEGFRGKTVGKRNADEGQNAEPNKRI